MGSAGTPSSGQGAFADVLPDRDAEFGGGLLDQGVLVVGEADGHGVAAGVAAGRPSCPGGHETRIPYTRKLAREVAPPDFRVYDKGMHTTTSQNAAHRNDAAWIKTAKHATVNGENYTSEYRNAFTGQTIRKDWRMTGRDWVIFDAADQIVGREHSLTWAKLEAALLADPTLRAKLLGREVV
jgi:hypothetical protein